MVTTKLASAMNVGKLRFEAGRDVDKGLELLRANASGFQDPSGRGPVRHLAGLEA